MAVIHIRVTDEQKARLEAEAEKQERSQTTLVRTALKRYFKQLDEEGE